MGKSAIIIVFQGLIFAVSETLTVNDTFNTIKNHILEVLHVANSLELTIYVTGFGKICLNAANNFFQYHWVRPYGSIFFEKIFMAEMDRHQ